eukprot:GGOE01001720.1.p1 GENE.GGOE01001720.1~~GGOE01001720.1.p1  ORF type:complete len:384 (-),score=92.38 GGOE01001720.1:233-1384(-)
MRLVPFVPLLLLVCLVAVLLSRWETVQEEQVLSRPPSIPPFLVPTAPATPVTPNSILVSESPVPADAHQAPRRSAPAIHRDVAHHMLRSRKQCAGFIAGHPSNAGFADSHTKRDNAMLAVLHLLGRNACYVHQPLGRNRHEAAPLDFDALVGFGRGWLLPQQVAGLRRELPPAKSLPEFLRHVETAGLHPDVVYIVPDFTVEDHCPSAPIWRQQYFTAAGSGGPATRFYPAGCWRVALHVRGADARKHRERAVSISYFQHVLQQVAGLTQGHQLCVHLFTDDGSPDHALPLQKAFPTLQVHLKGDANAVETFHHLVMADILLISKSGFSHLAGMISHGIKFAIPFWHSTNCDRWWIRASEAGHFNVTHFNLLWKEMVSSKGAT